MGLLLGWILSFTQEESRPRLLLPTHWSLLGWFETKLAGHAYGQRPIEQLGCVAPQKGYTRGTAAMAMGDTRRGGRQDAIQHAVQTTPYCMSDDIDPGGPKGK